MKLAWLVVAALSAASVQARDTDYSAAYSACMDASGGVTASMIDCIGNEHALQDAALNAAYAALRAALPAERRTQLQAVQRAWIAYRDANCGFYADPDGGTLARVSATECMLRETAARALELRTLLPVD
ncbi:lysozyme inhibitor LprI family protein [Chiayiivirga flava]|uniref:Uncharacterized protein YecT (DUF1311 family) n=1 Tax=Chiayiivirga flava TaxID=659595 RepID=A0A7W8G1U4_9GAMM|nr:lysozyme inhibitor LprI family protein [Chiayiivirga flava]MBB5209243.1 uncharacterized protein YecT (DUF1311 family) [Chiayiivirga flava]